MTLASARSSFAGTEQAGSALSVTPSRSLSTPSEQEPGLGSSCSGTLLALAGSEPKRFSVGSSKSSPSLAMGVQPGSSPSTRPSPSLSTRSPHQKKPKPANSAAASKRESSGKLAESSGSDPKKVSVASEMISKSLSEQPSSSASVAPSRSLSLS